MGSPRKLPQPPAKLTTQQSDQTSRQIAVGRSQRLQIFHLPSYSPESNPDERLNADLKHAIGSTVPVRTKARLKAATESHMIKLAETPTGSKPSSTIRAANMQRRNITVPVQ
jgi:hypothetical protein